jgi:hypothetical protein
MTHASRAHRQLDAALAECLARDGDPDSGGALLPSRFRSKDLRSMSRPRVLLATLSLRTSAKGREYLSGWLGKASVVGFRGEPDKFGNDTYNLYVSEPEPKDGTATTAAPRAPQRQEPVSAPVTRAGVDPDFDDVASW